MSSVILKFQQRGAWIHGAVAEIWVAELICALEAIRCEKSSLSDLLVDLESALESNWLVGVLIGGFDEHLKTAELRSRFLDYLATAHHELMRLPANDRGVVCRLDRVVSIDFLMPELQMIDDLFRHPERVPEPPAAFSLDKGWR
jgi:hypothetical protein